MREAEQRIGCVALKRVSAIRQGRGQMNLKFWFLILIGAASIPALMAQTTDSWSDNGNNLGSSFKWEKASEWSLGVAPSTAQTYVMMTNAIFGMGPFGRTVSID